MKKSFLFLFVCMFAQQLLYAQLKSDKVEVTWGVDQDLSRKIVFDDIIGSNESGIFVVKRLMRGKKPILIERYDRQMRLEKSVPVQLGERPNERNYEYCTQVDGKLLLFSTLLNRKSKSKLLFVQQIDPITLKPSKRLIQIGTINYSDASRRNSGSFTFKASVNEKRILIYYSLPYKKGENKEFFYHIYDSDLNLLWEKAIALDYKQELIEVVDYEVTESGDLYLLSRIFQNKLKAVVQGKPNYNYQISAYTNNANSVKEYPVDLGDKFLTDMKIALNGYGEIICGGFYSDNGTSSIKGSYFLKIDLESKKIISKSFKEFGLDFITQNMTDKQRLKTKRREARGKDVELFQYDLNDIVLKEDGGAILIGEQYFVRVSTYNDSQGNIRTTYHYFYNDIIVISIKSSGQIDWTEKIAKRQHTMNDGGFYSSYSLAVVGDKLNFIFNDNVKNLVASKINFGREKGVVHVFSRNIKTSTAVLVQLDSDGRQVKEALFNAKESEVLIRPKVSEQISELEMVIYGQKRKIERFGKITFK